MNVITPEDAALFETPNAVMRTYASPETTASDVAVWRAELAPGASGPRHVVSSEQVMVVVAGRPTVVGPDGEHTLAPGDGVVLRAGEERQLANRHEEAVVTLTCALPGATATPAGKDAVPIPWAR